MMGATELVAQHTVSPALELGAYEELWSLDGQSFKKIADIFTVQVGE